VDAASKFSVKAMDAPLSRMLMRMAYGAAQLPRVAWYVGHNIALHRLAETQRQRNSDKLRSRPHTDLPVPERHRLYLDMAALLMQDLANVEAGIYPFPADRDGSLPTLLRRSRLFFEDLPEIHRRRARRGHRDVLSARTRGTRPLYYLQNFHFQSGGWMTAESASRYDTQVEVLFNGTANAIRRQALVPLHEAFAGRDQRRLHLIDIGCGTGRFLESLKQTWPRLSVLGLDLSVPYIQYARRHLARRSKISLVVAKAETIPCPDNSQDAVTGIFLLHELPPDVRRSVFRECARVLKPDGRLVLLDSLQRGDRPDYDGLLELFPQSYHEPYYASYTCENFSALARECGLTPVRNVNAFVSKVMVFDKQ
jgi:ubiquinone/menaquinone biosynthesis C-methylase UbiE